MSMMSIAGALQRRAGAPAAAIPASRVDRAHRVLVERAIHAHGRFGAAGEPVDVWAQVGSAHAPGAHRAVAVVAARLDNPEMHGQVQVVQGQGPDDAGGVGDQLPVLENFDEAPSIFIIPNHQRRPYL
jgi:hypothetical protein